MHTILQVVHILIAVSLIGLVLVQRGKGAEMGAAFGSGASSTVFGSRGSASFLTRSTAVLALCFFLLTGLLSFSTNQKSDVKSVTEQVTPQAPSVPASQTPASPAVGSPPQEHPADVPVAPEK